MEIFLVTNGNWPSGYYCNKKNAEDEVVRLNLLIKELVADGRNVDTEEYYIVNIKTIDEYK